VRGGLYFEIKRENFTTPLEQISVCAALLFSGTFRGLLKLKMVGGIKYECYE
jgi:hypothetical protein